MPEKSVVQRRIRLQALLDDPGSRVLNRKSIRQIARDVQLSKNTVKKIIRSGVTELVYRRETLPRFR